MARGIEFHHRTLERYVLADERVVVATRRHWGKVLKPVATTLVAFVIVGLIAGLASPDFRWFVALLSVGWLVLAARMVWALLEWRNEWFIATNKRMLLIYGLVTHKVAMMPLNKVTDMSYSRSLMGQILGYGTFVLESAGQDQAMRRITWVTRPDATYRTVCDTLFGAPDEDADLDADDDGELPVADRDLFDDPWHPARDDAPSSAVRAGSLGPVPVPPPASVPVPPPPSAPVPPSIPPPAPSAGRVRSASAATLTLPIDHETTERPVPPSASLANGGHPRAGSAGLGAELAGGSVQGEAVVKAGPGNGRMGGSATGDGSELSDGWTVSDEDRAPFIRIDPEGRGRGSQTE